MVRRARATASGTATWPSASCCTRPCSGMNPQWPAADFDVDASRSAGWPTRRRSRDPDRGGHPLRHAAARGRQPARDRRGRRPRHLRLQVPRGRPGGPGAGGRGDRRRAGPSGSGCGRRGWWRSTSTRRSPATRPTRRSRTCSTPAPGSTSASTSCPARSASTASSPDGATDVAARVLWLDAFVANVDRTWRNPNLLLWHGGLWVIDHGAALYFHHAWGGGRRATRAVRRASPGTPPATCCASTPPSWRPSTTSCAPPGRRAVFARSGEVPDAWLGRCRAPRPGRRARGVRRLPGRPARHPPWLPGGGRMSRSSYQYVVLRCVPRVDREEFVNVGVVLYCQAADFLDVACRVDADRLLALDPRLDVDQVCESWRSSTASAPATRAGARPPAPRHHGSASSRPRARPSSSPARCTAASPPTPAASWSVCSNSSSVVGYF